MVDTIKFSEMPNAGNINNNDIMPSLRSGANVILNNPWTFLPPGTTAQRPTPSSTVNYRLRFNTDEQLYEYYDAVLGAWTQLQESAFTQGPFITYTASASLPDAQNLGILANGILKQTITSAIATLDIAVSGTDYWAPGNALTRTQVPTVGDDVTNKTYVDAQVAGSVTSVQGTANQVLVNATSGTPQTGALTLTTPQDIGLTSSPTFDNLQLSGGLIVGSDGTTVFELVNTALSVNHVRTTSQVTGTNPSLSAIGTDTNIGLSLISKGTGAISLITANTTQPILIYSGTSNQHITRFNMANTAADRSVTWQDSSGTVAYLSDVPSVTPSALTKTDDTNVTLTLGGSPSVALLAATSLTLGWTGQLGLTRGGSNASLTASNGGIVYSTASAMAILAGTATANLPLLSGSSAAPSWGAFALNLGGALTTAGALSTVGAFGATFTFTNTTGVTFPTSGTLATTSQIPTGAALTKTDDTNVTLTLGGSPTTALVNAASLTLGWTGQLGLTRGGSNASLTASNGGLVYSTASALAILAGTATAGQIPRSGASGAPSWSTATYPATAGTQYNALASDGTNFTSQTLTSLLDGAFGNAQGDILYRNASAWVILAPGTSGQFLKTQGAAANPIWASGTVNGFTQIVTQVFTSSGTYTPTSGMKYALIEGVGAGGGSGGATSNAASTYAGSGGGGGGGYSSTVASAATVGASQTVTIGAAGTGGANGTTAGGNGGDTSVGSIMIAKGGSGSQKSQDGGSGGLGGVVGTGDFSSTGNSGTNGQYQIPTVSTPAIVGTGGGSFWGGGGLPTVVGQGNAGTAYGGGGGGSGSFNQVGNAGAAGFKGAVRITEFL